MEIRVAEKADIDAICAIYDASRTFMHESGNPEEWPEKGKSPYPSRRDVKIDLMKGTLFVCVGDSGEVVGCFDFEAGPIPAYRIIEGAWLNKFPYFVIQRMGTLRQREGVGGAMVDWVIKAANNIRLDTHADNKPMQALLESRGFQRCGTIDVPHVGERVGYHFQRPDDRPIKDKPFWAWMR